jgi:cytochrome P450
MQENSLFTMDLKALSYVLKRSDIYWKPDAVRRETARMSGDSVLIAEGDQHRLQRKLLNPAFGPGQVRELTGVFLNKANEVCMLWVVRDTFLTTSIHFSFKPNGSLS